jgi:hypothetical protein
MRPITTIQREDLVVLDNTNIVESYPNITLPLSYSFAKTEQQRQAMDVFLQQGSISRPFFLPPGVAPDRVTILRKAFEDVLKDPELQTEAAKSGLDTLAQGGDEVQKLIERLYAASPEVIAFLRKGVVKP